MNCTPQKILVFWELDARALEGIGLILEILQCKSLEG